MYRFKRGVQTSNHLLEHIPHNDVAWKPDFLDYAEFLLFCGCLCVWSFNRYACYKIHSSNNMGLVHPVFPPTPYKEIDWRCLVTMISKMCTALINTFSSKVLVLVNSQMRTSVLNILLQVKSTSSVKERTLSIGINGHSLHGSLTKISLLEYIIVCFQ
ncbi:hypothetical protein TNIN_404991 [Trichonephila inaurata madagascariensis]|uniref:Uncharacterized protein n=1 Tax=Trichonephila inaurata madagascariensis TaxID=2747483 RepID=A0A8X6IXR8_9ARAC|nr:hypothetical protein TNIN_404991 [Trichonephila inaurata madagascariensis]